MEEGFEGEFDFSNMQGDFTGGEFFEEPEEAAEEAELESPPKKGGKGHHGKHHGKGKGKGKDHGKEDKQAEKHGKDKDGHKKGGKHHGGKPALFTLTYKNKDGVSLIWKLQLVIFTIQGRQGKTSEKDCPWSCTNEGEATT